ncbi:hypothetical protein [Ureaplasma urealyticum]|uniref:hypothetical protein n=1 Tax=Ureaplasma urealyticum TaxID=2130 RepID=UPI00307E5FD6
MRSKNDGKLYYSEKGIIYNNQNYRNYAEQTEFRLKQNKNWPTGEYEIYGVKYWTNKLGEANAYIEPAGYAKSIISIDLR